MASLTGLIQEGLITLLLFDKENGCRVANLIPLDSFDAPYRRFAEKAVAYWKEFSEPPGEHALDICRQLEESDPKKAEMVRRLYDSAVETREGINAKYVLSQASAFVDEQKFRSGIITAAGLLENGKLADAKAVMHRATKAGLDLFHPGLLFGRASLSSMLTEEVSCLPTGIPLLDDKRLGPAVGELHLLIAPSSFGKSWWLNHLGKIGLLNRQRVVYITLEMSEKKVARRFLQSFCAVSTRREKLISRVFEEDELGRFSGINSQELIGIDSLSDDDIEQKLRKPYKNFERRRPIIIRQFPTGSLTMSGLLGYLDSLEAQLKIVPTLLLVDYPDLMRVEGRDEHRIAIGRVYQELRGLAIDRNIAVAVVSQTNRQALGKKLITERDIAEDYSKIATSDVALSYNQTVEEQKLGLARLHVMKARNEEKGFTILVSQNYAMGQFCISSTRMVSKGYWDAVKDGDVFEEPPRRRKREQL